MTLDGLVLWIVVGGIAGLLADAVVKKPQVGVVGAVIVGILGAFIGGWLFSVLHIRIAVGLVGDIITAFAGAVVLLLVLRALRRL